MQRVSIRGQQVTAVDYSRLRAACQSYSICVQKTPSHDEDGESGEDDAPGDLCASIYGNVLGFDKIDETTERFARNRVLQNSDQSQGQKVGYERVDMALKTTKLMPLEMFRHKLQFFQTQDMQSTAKIMGYGRGKSYGPSNFLF